MRPPFGLAASRRRVAPSYFFSNFFVPREGHDTVNFSLCFGRSELETAGHRSLTASTRRRPGLSPRPAKQSECKTSLLPSGGSRLTVVITVLKITVIRTVMDWNEEIAQ